MYHPGKVLAVFGSKGRDIKSADDTTQASVEMWDENVFTFAVEAKIAKVIKEKDIVLVDYRPISEKAPVARQLISKIVYKKKGKQLWERYKDYARDKKRESAPRNPAKSYMG